MQWVPLISIIIFITGNYIQCMLVWMPKATLLNLVCPTSEFLQRKVLSSWLSCLWTTKLLTIQNPPGSSQRTLISCCSWTTTGGNWHSGDLSLSGGTSTNRWPRSSRAETRISAGCITIGCMRPMDPIRKSSKRPRKPPNTTNKFTNHVFKNSRRHPSQKLSSTKHTF